MCDIIILGGFMIKFILRFLYWILLNVLNLIEFFYELFVDIFAKRDKRNPKDIVALDYYALLPPDIDHYTIYKNDEDLKVVSDPDDYPYKLNNKEFNSLIKIIEDNKIMKCKTYSLSWPFLGLISYYLSFYECDGGNGDLDIVLYFKDGSQKKMKGFSNKKDKIMDYMSQLKLSDYRRKKEYAKYEAKAKKNKKNKSNKENDLFEEIDKLYENNNNEDW